LLNFCNKESSHQSPLRIFPGDHKQATGMFKFSLIFAVSVIQYRYERVTKQTIHFFLAKSARGFPQMKIGINLYDIDEI